jgi:UDP-glucose 4-epimerase
MPTTNLNSGHIDKVTYDMKVTRVLVTGANGFIGKHLCKRLNADNSFNIVDGKSGSYRKLLDVTNFGQLASACRNVDTVVHLAGKTSIKGSLGDPYKSYYINYIGALNLLEASRLRDVKRLINVSTFVYGQPYEVPINEKHRIVPHSPYTKSKLLAEMICQYYSSDFGIDVVTLRPFQIYGPGARPDSFIPSAIRQIARKGEVFLNGKSVSRDFLFVDDFVVLIIAILNSFPNGYNVYNVGFGKSHTLEKIAKILADLMNKRIKVNYEEAYSSRSRTNVRADITKVSEAFRWKPRVTIEEGLKYTMESNSF